MRQPGHAAGGDRHRGERQRRGPDPEGAGVVGDPAAGGGTAGGGRRRAQPAGCHRRRRLREQAEPERAKAAGFRLRAPSRGRSKPGWARFATRWSGVITSSLSSGGWLGGWIARPSASSGGSKWRRASSWSARVLSGSPKNCNSPRSCRPSAWPAKPFTIVSTKSGHAQRGRDEPIGRLCDCYPKAFGLRQQRGRWPQSTIGSAVFRLAGASSSRQRCCGPARRQEPGCQPHASPPYLAVGGTSPFRPEHPRPTALDPTEDRFAQRACAVGERFLLDAEARRMLR